MKKRRLKQNYDLLLCSYEALDRLRAEQRAVAERLMDDRIAMAERLQQCTEHGAAACAERDELREQLDGMATMQDRLLRAENVCRALGGCLADEELQRNTSVFITNLLGFHEEWARFLEEKYGIILSRIISRHNAPPAHADGAGADLPAPAEPGGVDPR